MFVCPFCGFTPPWGTHQKALLDQKWFIDFFNRLSIFRNCCGQGINTDWATFEFIDQSGQYLIVHFIQAMGIYMERFESIPCDVQVDLPIPFDLGEIPNTSQ